MEPQIERDAPAAGSAATEFDRVTAVRALGDGRFAATIVDGWGAPIGPNGGYLAAVVARAMKEQIAPADERQLRSLSVHYLRRTSPGEVELALETMRAGRRFSTLRATMSQDGKEVITALGAFSTTGLATAATWSPPLPDVGPAPAREAESLPPEEYRPDGSAWLVPPPDRPSIFHRLKIAPQIGEAPFSGRELIPGEAPESGGWTTLPQPRPVDAVYLTLLADAWWPPSLEPLTEPAIAPTVDLTVHVRADLPPGGFDDQPVLGRFRTAAAQDGTMEEDGELFLADGTLLAQSRQLALLAPVG